MKLVQKILSHGLLIVFIVAAFFAYTQRAALFPQWFGKAGKVVQQAANEKAGEPMPAPAERKVSRPLPEKTVSKKTVEPLDETARGTAEETPPPPAPAAPVEDELKAPPQAPEDTSAVQQESEPPTAANAPAPLVAVDTSEQAQSDAAGSAAGQTPGSTVETPVEIAEVEPAQAPAATVPEAAAVPQPAETAEPVTATAEPVTTAETAVAAVQAAGGDRVRASSQAVLPADVRLEKQLEQARQRYWRHDLRGAAAAYRALSEAYPENPDVWGEVGNFYFSLRQRKPASTAYSRCIQLLIDQGEQVRARQLLNVLYRLDALKARELETRLRQAGG